VETPADSTIDQTSFYTDAAAKIMTNVVPEVKQTFQITHPSDGFGGLVLKPWGERKRSVFDIQPILSGELAKIPGIRMFAVTPSALPGGSVLNVEFILGSTEEPAEILKHAQKLQLMASTNGMFRFPPIIDTKIDQPEIMLIIDRDKAAALGLDMATIGADLATLVGGNFVNRFSLDGRSYKVIPQLERIARLNPGLLENHYVKGPAGKLIPLSTFAHF